MEREIAALIPEEAIVSVEQKPTGALFPCNNTQHTWYGSTTIRLTDGSDVEGIVKTIEEHYQEEDRFDIRTRLNFAREYEVQLMSPTSAETYIFGKTAADTVRIDSGSVCFTLPEGVYPGGKF
ncbi:hypothetical protein [Microbacterium sp. XT11]|uniref:hypothetical protein n=1 Tax=Microbacterium sp. XT11 TaxID=367477 RepID=UPI00082D450E|nr:hypothetical protein [Microbacterium sp. XT11]